MAISPAARRWDLPDGQDRASEGRQQLLDRLPATDGRAGDVARLVDHDRHRRAVHLIGLGDLALPLKQHSLDSVRGRLAPVSLRVAAGDDRYLPPRGVSQLGQQGLARSAARICEHQHQRASARAQRVQRMELPVDPLELERRGGRSHGKAHPRPGLELRAGLSPPSRASREARRSSVRPFWESSWSENQIWKAINPAITRPAAMTISQGASTRVTQWVALMPALPQPAIATNPASQQHAVARACAPRPARCGSARSSDSRGPRRARLRGRSRC